VIKSIITLNYDNTFRLDVNISFFVEVTFPHQDSYKRLGRNIQSDRSLNAQCFLNASIHRWSWLSFGVFICPTTGINQSDIAITLKRN
jgi:hypothetical protein